MTLNKLGNELYDIWEKNYFIENNKLGGDSENGDFVEGWCIIDNSDYVKTLTDLCGLWIFGYDVHALSHVDECIELYGADDAAFMDYTFADVRAELLKYFC